MAESTLPRAPETLTATPLNAQTPLAALAEPITPVETCFVRNHFAIPRLDLRQWRLRLRGAIGADSAISYDELTALGWRELDMVLECAGNGRTLLSPPPEGVPWGERAVACVRFGGVPFREVVARAELDADAVEFVFTGADSGRERGQMVRFQRSVGRAVALHPDTLLATHMNGEHLTAVHGAPVRLVVPGWYGVTDVKWLVEVRAVTKPFTGLFQTDEYVYRDAHGNSLGPVTALRVKSLITSPEPGQVVDRGSVAEVRGWAWSGGVPIKRVEVRLDDNDWYPATLTPPSGAYAWTGWQLRWAAKHAGRHRLLARATDEDGRRQPVTAPYDARGYGCNPVSSVDVVVR